MDGPVDSRSRTIKNHGQKFTLRLLARLGKKGNVTLMCHCADDPLIAPPDKFVALRYQQESVLSIELGDACEGQLSSIG
jgi:hypothetical protein